MTRPNAMTNRELYRALMELSASLTCANVEAERDGVNDGLDRCGYDTCPVRKMEEIADEIASRLDAKGATIV